MTIALQPAPILCGFCSKELIPTGTPGRPRKFCDRACKNEVRNGPNRVRLPAAGSKGFDGLTVGRMPLRHERYDLRPGEKPQEWERFVASTSMIHGGP